MCTVLLPPGVNPIAFNNYIMSYHIISYHISNDDRWTELDDLLGICFVFAKIFFFREVGRQLGEHVRAVKVKSVFVIR
jgi:hypothetical protein